MDNELLVKTIRTLCKDNNISVSQLESDLNFGAGLISRWTKSSPSLDKIIDIADYFHVTLDDVVGRNQSSGNEFIDKLIEMTEDKTIIWHSYNGECSKVKKYIEPPIDASDFFNNEDYYNYLETHMETSYYATFNKGYISLHSCHLINKTNQPYELKIFLQADDKSSLIKEDYSTDVLLPLWLKVLLSLNEDKPDEIKTSDFKQQILSSKPMTKSEKSLIKNKALGKIMVDSSLKALIDNKELRHLVDTFTDPKMIKSINETKQIIEYFDKIEE